MIEQTWLKKHLSLFRPALDIVDMDFLSQNNIPYYSTLICYVQDASDPNFDIGLLFQKDLQEHAKGSDSNLIFRKRSLDKLDGSEDSNSSSHSSQKDVTIYMP